MEHISLHQDLDLLFRIKQGLDRNEFFNLYQPIYNNDSTLSLSGVECLTRWNSNDSLLSAADYIPVIENSILNSYFFFYTLNLALSQLKEYLSPSFKLSVNVPFSLVFLPEFSYKVLHTLQTQGVDPCFLMLEVTETHILPRGYIHQHPEILVVAEGVTLIIDDFGSGSTSLMYLHDSNFSELKLDQAFLSPFYFGSTRNSAILHSIVKLCKKLNILTTLEGVESAEHLELARRLGVDKLQGYYLSKPLTLDNLTALLIKEGSK